MLRGFGGAGLLIVRVYKNIYFLKMQYVVTQEKIAHSLLNVPSTQKPSPFNVYVNQASLGMGIIVQVRILTRPTGHLRYML